MNNTAPFLIVTLVLANLGACSAKPASYDTAEAARERIERTLFADRRRAEIEAERERQERERIAREQRLAAEREAQRIREELGVRRRPRLNLRRSSSKDEPAASLLQLRFARSCLSVPPREMSTPS